jgi:hypothetical protein
LISDLVVVFIGLLKEYVIDEQPDINYIKFNGVGMLSANVRIIINF